MEDTKIKFGEWQETEHKIPVKVPVVEIDEQGRVTKVGEAEGERVYKERYTYAQLVPLPVCKRGEHYFEFVDGGRRINGRISVKCRYCEIGANFIVGINRLEDGKLLTYQPPES